MAVAIADSPHQTITPSCTRLLSPLLSWLSPSPTVHIRQSHHHVQGCSRRCSHGCRHRRQSTSDNHTIMYKVALAAALMAVAIADKVPVAYAPAPAPYKPEKLPPQPFAYEYGVADDYSKANFKKTESQDAEGKVIGSFVIALPDGRIQ